MPSQVGSEARTTGITERCGRTRGGSISGVGRRSLAVEMRRGGGAAAGAERVDDVRTTRADIHVKGGEIAQLNERLRHGTQ